MNCFNDGTDEENYEHIYWTILGGNVMSISLIIMEGKYGSIDTDDSLCHGYYIIKFSSSPYTLQADLSIFGQVISSDEMVCEGTYYFQSILILVILFYKKLNPLPHFFFKDKNK